VLLQKPSWKILSIYKLTRNNMKIDMRKAKKEKIRRFLGVKNENYIFDGESWYKEMQRMPKGGVTEKIATNYSI
jgi:hypothetical protein